MCTDLAFAMYTMSLKNIRVCKRGAVLHAW